MINRKVLKAASEAAAAATAASNGSALLEEEHVVDAEGETFLSSESEAPISERAASGFTESPSVGSPRVQFEKIREEEAGSPPPGTPAAGDEDRKPRRHHKHDHK